MAGLPFRFKIPDWSIYALLLGLIVFHSMRSTDDIAPMASPELGDALPGTSPLDPTVMVEIEARTSDGAGTAFSVDGKGTWMTARHVVDGCSQVGLLASGTRAVRVDETLVSDDSDTAILKTSWQRKALPSDLNSERNLRETGYFFGFPQGRPGEVAGSLLGRHQLITRGRYNTSEAVLAWAEISRTRGLSGSLAGLSGAPAFDADGETIGVVSAESPRRGRVYTVAPSSIRGLLSAQYDKLDAQPISLERFGTEADRYRRDRRITQVICLVD